MKTNILKTISLPIRSIAKASFISSVLQLTVLTVLIFTSSCDEDYKVGHEKVGSVDYKKFKT